MSVLSLRPLRWALLPLWAAEVFTAAKTCDVNPILGHPRLNRRGLHVWRGRLAHRLAERRRRRLERLVSEADRQAFQRDGMVIKPGFAPRELFARIKAELEAFQGDAFETLEGETVNRRIPLDEAALARLPACRELIGMPEFQGLLRYVSSVDIAPSLSIQALFAKAERGKPDHQTRWHMDTFHPTMKAWLFLHDVQAGDGPFTYAPGSHRRTPRRDAWERQMSVDAADPATPSRGGSFRIGTEALARIGCRAPQPVTVGANTLVVADTYGFHARGIRQAPGVRIAFYATSRPSPFLPWCGIDWRRFGPARRLGDALRNLKPWRDRPSVRRVLGVGPWTPPERWPARPRPSANPSSPPW